MGKLPLLSALAAVVPDAAALDCAADVACAEEEAGAEEGAADDAATVDDAPCPSGCWIVDKFGKAVSACARATGAATSNKLKRPIEARIANCVRRSTRVVGRSGVSRGPLKEMTWTEVDAESCDRSCLRG